MRVLISLCALAAPAWAEVKLPQVFSDHMVLQRGEPAPVWGWAEPGEAVEVAFGGQRHSATADDEGRWRVTLEPMHESGEGQPLAVRAASGEVTLEDVVVGEVWLCSGQSNMVWSVDGADGAEEAKAAARDPRLRMFTGANVSTPELQDDVPGRWLVARPETVGGFSATAYYFGRELMRRLDVPIGLVNVSWGGSTVQAWTRMETLREVPAAKRVLDEYAVYSKEVQVEPSLRAAPEVDDAGWEPATLPATFKELGHDIDGVIWFRERVELPEEWRGRELVLELGSIDDEDHTYVQGVLVGNTNNWQAQRRYRVPAALTDSETLTLAVRVRDGAGPGGFNGPREALRLFMEGREAEALSLAGDWRMLVGSTVSPPPDQHKPAHLYNGMLHPLRALALRGVLWYQGENNAIGPESIEYYELFPAFVRDLRAAFGRPALPFVLVQLPNFGRNDDSFWRYPIVRDAQLRAFRELEHVGMAVTTDIGDAQDIHPRNKLDVGLRLARWALRRVYAVDEGAPTGPIFQEARFDGAEVRASFETWGGELRARDGAALGGFELAGADRVFHPATAELQGPSAVLVQSAAVPQPVALRYAWANDPADANLVGEGELPASPFRTDDWEPR